jgi:hypothetical protein
MAATTASDAAGAADWLSITPAPWPPPGPVLMTAITTLRQNTAVGYLGAIQPGTTFWASAADAPNLLANSMAIIAPPGATARPEPPLTAHGTPGIAAGTSNASG